MKSLKNYLIMETGNGPFKYIKQGYRMVKTSKDLNYFGSDDYGLSKSFDNPTKMNPNDMLNDIFYPRNGGKRFIKKAIKDNLYTDDNEIVLGSKTITIWGPKEIKFTPENNKEQIFIKYTDWELAFLDYITDKYNIKWNGYNS